MILHSILEFQRNRFTCLGVVSLVSCNEGLAFLDRRADTFPCVAYIAYTQDSKVVRIEGFRVAKRLMSELGGPKPNAMHPLHVAGVSGCSMRPIPPLPPLPRHHPT